MPKTECEPFIVEVTEQPGGLLIVIRGAPMAARDVLELALYLLHLVITTGHLDQPAAVALDEAIEALKAVVSDTQRSYSRADH